MIRLTVESFYYLQNTEARSYEDLLYQCDSTLSGVESFRVVATIYRLISDDAKSVLVLEGTSIESLKEQFVSQYQKFCSEHGFKERCRLLLDLFRLQIVFAGINYY